MELKITKEKVIEAASKCGNAKDILKTLFPEAFNDTNIDLWKESGIMGRALFKKEGDATNSLISLRKGENVFYLSNDLDWRIERADNYSVLIPKNK